MYALVLAADPFAVVGGVVTTLIVTAGGVWVARINMRAKNAEAQTEAVKDKLADTQQLAVIAPELIDDNRRRIEEIALRDGAVEALRQDNAEMAQQLIEMSKATSEFTRTQTEQLVQAQEEKARMGTQLAHATATIERAEMALKRSEDRNLKLEVALERSNVALEAATMQQQRTEEQLRLCTARESEVSTRLAELIALHRGDGGSDVK